MLPTAYDMHDAGFAIAPPGSQKERNPSPPWTLQERGNRGSVGRRRLCPADGRQSRTCTMPPLEHFLPSYGIRDPTSAFTASPERSGADLFGYDELDEVPTSYQWIQGCFYFHSRLFSTYKEVPILSCNDILDGPFQSDSTYISSLPPKSSHRASVHRAEPPFVAPAQRSSSRMEARRLRRGRFRTRSAWLVHVKLSAGPGHCGRDRRRVGWMTDLKG